MALASGILEALVGTSVAGAAAVDLEPAFEDALARGSRAWPDFTPDAVTIAQVANAAARGASLPQWLRDCDAGEVWLAAGCVESSAVALREFDSRYIAALESVLISTQLHPEDRAEIKQRVRMKLLSAGEQGVLRIAQYSGQGKLFSMAKVIAIRSAVDHARVAARHPERQASESDQAIERLLDHGSGPEVVVMDAQQRLLLKQAFEDAVARLEPLERGVMRLHLVQRLSIDEIAGVHGVHRATAARWLIRIRDRLAETTRAAVRQRLDLDASEYESFMRLVDGSLDLSLSRVFPEDDSAR